MVVARQFSARGLWGTSAINNAGGDAVAKKAIDHVKAMCGEVSERSMCWIGLLNDQSNNISL